MSLEEFSNHPVLQPCLWDNCSIQFGNFEDLFRHLKEAHVNFQNPSLPRDCRWANTCNYQTNEKKHLISHLRSHLDWRPFSCEICGSRFKHEHEIRRHVDKLHQSPIKNEPPPKQFISPNSYSNNSGSAYESPQKVGSLNSSLSPMTDVMVSESDNILAEIVEYALGIRHYLSVENDKKAHLFSMGISESVINLPRHQLRRCILDGLYQNLVLMSVPENQNVITNQFSNPVEYIPHNFPSEAGLDHTSLSGAPTNMNFNNQQQGIGNMINPYAMSIPQPYPAIPSNTGFTYPEALPASGQFQTIQPVPPNFSFQPDFSRPSFPEFNYNNHFINAVTQEQQMQNAARCLPNIQQHDYINFPSVNPFQTATQGSPRALPSSTPIPDVKKEDSPINIPSPLSEDNEVSLSVPDSPASKYGVDSIFSSIIPNIKSFLTSVPTALSSRSNSEDGKAASSKSSPKLKSAKSSPAIRSLTETAGSSEIISSGTNEGLAHTVKIEPVSTTLNIEDLHDDLSLKLQAMNI